MEDIVFSLIKTLSWPGAIGLTAFLAYKSGLFGSLSKKLSNGKSSNESDSRLADLEKFKVEAENNHFHDLSELKEDVRKLTEKVNFIDKEVAVIKSKINGK